MARLLANKAGEYNMEDYLELGDSKVRRFIAESHRKYLAGKSRPAEEVLAELRQQKVRKSRTKRRRKV